MRDGPRGTRARLLKIWLNGALADEGEALRVAPSDHGFLRRRRRLRDAALATAASRSRSTSTCARLERRLPRRSGIAAPRAELEQAAHAVVEANGLARRAHADHGHERRRAARPRARRRPADGAGRRAAARAVAARRRPRRSRACAATSTARSPGSRPSSLAESVIALAEARAAGADEALLLNTARRPLRGDDRERLPRARRRRSDAAARRRGAWPGSRASTCCALRARGADDCRPTTCGRPTRRSSPPRRARCSRWSRSTAGRSATASPGPVTRGSPRPTRELVARR